MSTMTTEFAAPVSRTQMNFSLSIVRLVKEMHCGLTPVLVSCWGDGRGGLGQSPGTPRAISVPFSSPLKIQDAALDHVPTRPP
jgi:hypothetical protein